MPIVLRPQSAGQTPVSPDFVPQPARPSWLNTTLDLHAPGPAAEISLLTFIEILLAPVWVWIFFDEVPSDYTVVGGVLIVGAVLSHTFLGATEVR